VLNERVQDPITLQISGEGSSTRQGVAALGTLRLLDRLSLELRATYNHARLSDAYANPHDDHPSSGVFGSDTTSTSTLPEGDDVHRVPGVADFQAFARLNGQITDRVSAWASWRGVGPHVPIGEPTVRTRSYSVTDVGASWSITPGQVIDLEVLNAFDTRYVELRSSGYVVPGNPLSIRAQVRISSSPF
jgi:outer membrane receptor protein involved in Fe transport